MTEVVRYTIKDAIALVSVDNPPVNTLTREVRAGLKQSFEALRGKDVKAIVLACAGKTFLSGGDMREFETGVQEPGYHEVLRLIEDSAVPVVAAVHGTVMGGGVETAIACHYRIAAEGTRFGFPEITLGIIPGAGGTQRMPRLIGLEPALDMMLSGKPLSAAQARDAGFVDAVVSADLIECALAYARDLLAMGAGPRRTRERSVAGGEKVAAVIAARRAQADKTMRNRNSPKVLLDAVEASVTRKFDDGIAFERSLSNQVERATEGRAFRHLFFAEREVSRIRVCRQTSRHGRSPASASWEPAPWAGASACVSPMPASPSSFSTPAKRISTAVWPPSARTTSVRSPAAASSRNSATSV